MANDSQASRVDVPSGNMPDEFDRAQGMLQGLTGVTKTGTRTFTVVPPLGVGGARTYIIQTYRQRDEHAEDDAPRSKDIIFLQVATSAGLVRLALPAEVGDTILRQRDTLTSITRKKLARAKAAERKAAGVKPNTAGLDAWRAKGSPRKARKRRKGGK